MQTSKPKKLTAASLDEFPLIIAATPATKQERRVALAIILILTLVFIVIAPFASVQLPRVDAFVPALQTVLCVTDLITAALLFSLYSIQPLPGLLALASGYIFSGLFAFLQTLAFPGAYAPSGLIGDPLSSAPYLFFLWHIAFPLAVTVYALSDDRPRTNDPPVRSTIATIAITIACTLVLTAGLTWAVTAGARYLPNLFVDQTRQAPITSYFSGRYLDFERRSASPVVFKKAHVTRCLVNGDTFCDFTRPYVDNSPNDGALYSRLVHSAELRTDRRLYGSDRAAYRNHLALCPPCPNHSLTTTRTRQSTYELGRRHGRNRS